MVGILINYLIPFVPLNIVLVYDPDPRTETTKILISEVGSLLQTHIVSRKFM